MADEVLDSWEDMIDESGVSNYFVAHDHDMTMDAFAVMNDFVMTYL